MLGRYVPPEETAGAARGDARCHRRHATISGHRRRGFAGGKQCSRVARRPISTKSCVGSLCFTRASRSCQH